MSSWERTSMELPRALSGSKELMTWPGVASTWTVAACGSVADADWALALCPTAARVIMMAIADLLRSFRADIRPTLHAMKSPSCIGFPFGVMVQLIRRIPPAAKAATDCAAFTDD